MPTKNTFFTFLLPVLLSLSVAAVVCEYKGDQWEEKVRKAIYTLSKDSIPSYAATIIDEKGIPYVHYAAQNGVAGGDEYNPTIISNYAIDYYDLIREKKDTMAQYKFLHCVEWLIANITYTDNYALYRFNWRQPFYDSVGMPWTSGMTSGRAIEVFADAYKLYHSDNYLVYAKALLRGFYQPIQSGGFTYKEPGGWWYEEYADSTMHTPRVLDGHIYACLGVREFMLLNNDDSAAFIVKQGIAALKDHLPGYDKGDGWSYYDAYHKVSDKKYHMLLTSLMKTLGEITGDNFFNAYYRKWNAPLVKPYVYRIFRDRNRSGLILYFLMSLFVWILLRVGIRVGRKMVVTKN